MKNINGVLIPDYNMAGKVAIVTGGGSGIGRAAAIQLAYCGASVVIAGIPLSQSIEVQDEIRGFGGKALGVEADVSYPENADMMVKRAVEEFGSVDIMISNAGVSGKLAPLLEQSAEDFQKILDINLKGIFSTSCAAASQMIKQGRGGRIVNTSSIALIEGGGGLGFYGASKAGVSTLTRTMAFEWAPNNITVNAIAPGRTLTGISQKALEDPDLLKMMTSRIPIGHVAQPSEIAALMLFLASDLASYITGATLICDGGATIGGF